MPRWRPLNQSVHRTAFAAQSGGDGAPAGGNTPSPPYGRPRRRRVRVRCAGPFFERIAWSSLLVAQWDGHTTAGPSDRGAHRLPLALRRVLGAVLPARRHARVWRGSRPPPGDRAPGRWDRWASSILVMPQRDYSGDSRPRARHRLPTRTMKRGHCFAPASGGRHGPWRWYPA
jgi:hypothetical protein